MGTFPIRIVLSNYQNNYDPMNKPRRGKPVIVPECPVVQQVNPLSYEIKYQEEDAKRIQKQECNPVLKSGTCSKGVHFPSYLNRNSNLCYQESTFVKKPQLDYAQYIQKKKAPLTGKDSHYPPMVSRNSTFVSVPNFSYSDFISRVTCK
jgi:hypothetical protein